MKSITKLFFGLLVAAFATLAISTATGWGSTSVACGLLALSIVSAPMFKSGYAFMAVSVEIWEQDILNNLFKNNDFAKRAYSADQYVLAGKVVHIPRAGTPSTVTKNQDTFPQTAVKRTDDDITYAIDSFYSTPRHIEQIEKYELSYDKRQSAMGEDQMALIETAMDGLIYNWGPAVANVVLTKGADKAASLSGATGNRKAFTKASLQAVKINMDGAKIPHDGRVALLTADHYNEFYNSLSDAEKTNFNNVGNLAEGIIGRYLGFDIMMRSTVLRYRGADDAVVKVDEYASGFGASDKTDDRAGSLVYHDKSVERALGGVEMFDQPRNPLYYGDVFSFLLRMGGRIRRSAGVYAIVDGLAA